MTYELNGRTYQCSMTPADYSDFTTRHGLVRTMERADKNRKQALRMIQNAWIRGKKADDLPLVKQREYMEYRESVTEDGKVNLRVYAGNLFIFSSRGILITMYPLPQSWGKKPTFAGKEHVRDFRTYRQICNDDWKDVDPADFVA